MGKELKIGVAVWALLVKVSSGCSSKMKPALMQDPEKASGLHPFSSIQGEGQGVGSDRI